MAILISTNQHTGLFIGWTRVKKLVNIHTDVESSSLSKTSFICILKWVTTKKFVLYIEMVNACPNCRSSEIEYDNAAGNSVCLRCGTVLEENTVVAEVTFAELANGASVLEGQFISADRGKATLPTIFGRRVGLSKSTAGDSAEGSGPGESREITLANGRRRILALAGAVGLTGEHYVDAAHRWYALALQHQFTRGRKGPNVIAACLYIVCRQEKTPHMLLDFADVLCTSVYSLGGTFLRLVRLLNLEMPIVDPSFFVARFAARLEFGDRTAPVSNTALRLVARMKRDWIQTGRRPAGVCAAGLIIAARMHGFRRTEAEVVRVVRICEATLKKRLEEFGRTPSSQLTPQEFEGIWLEQEADPPSFTHTRSKPADPDTIHVLPITLRPSMTSLRPIEEAMPPTPLASSQDDDDDDGSGIIDENPSLSDVEIDEEMQSVFLNEDEIDIKTRYWSELNKDYLEKEAAQMAALLKEQENTTESNENISASGKRIVKEGYEDGAIEPSSHPLKRKVGIEKSKRIRPSRDRTREISIAATPAEATRQVLQSKRFSKKINYQALDELFASTAASIVK